MRIVSICFRWSCYLLFGALALVALLMYLDALVFYPSFAYHFEFYQLYFVITLLLLPFFRLRHPRLFISDDQFVSLRQKALDQHHQDVASHYCGGRWDSSGVRVAAGIQVACGSIPLSTPHLIPNPMMAPPA